MNNKITRSITCSKRRLASFSRWARPLAAGVLILLACLAGAAAHGADEPGLITKTKEAAQETAAAVKETGRSAVDEAGQLWQRVDAARLKNRTPDEIVAWVMMGALVGGLAGMMTSLKTSGLGKVGRLLLGLAGACLGGMVVRVAKLDFGWGPVLIRYEELFVSLLGAILLIVLAKLVRSRSSKKTPNA